MDTTTQIAEYSETEAALATLEHRLKGRVYAVNTTAGMAEAKQDRAELRTLRTSLDKLRLKLNEDDHARIKFRNEKAKSITVRFSALEEPIDEQIKAEAVKASTLSKLRTVRDLEEAAQGERERLAAERAEIDRQKAAQEALQREQDRIAAERRAEEDRLAKAERERLAAVAEAERAEQARVDADERAKLKTEQDRVHTEQTPLDQKKAVEETHKLAAVEKKYLANLKRGATLLGAAIDAHKFLTAKGYVDTDITLALGFAIEKETQKEAA